MSREESSTNYGRTFTNDALVKDIKTLRLDKVYEPKVAPKIQSTYNYLETTKENETINRSGVSRNV